MAQADRGMERNVELSLQLQEASRSGQLELCKALIEQGAAAWYQNDIGWTALHCAADAGHAQIVHFLLRNGAVWNLVDNLGFTAADIAYSYNDAKIFGLIVDEGVRAEMLKAILEAQDDGEEDMDEDRDEGSAPAAQSATPQEAGASRIHEEAEPASTASDNKAFLQSKLTFEGSSENGDERCVDSEGNGVMMGWEAPIMQETARLLCKSHKDADDFAVLNVGFGLGIIDTELQKYKPSRHVIIEPHPDVLEHAREKGWFEREGVEIFQGTWQDFIKSFEAGDVVAEFDAIYFDTFSEHYKDLHAFFDHLPNLLRDETSLFSFFHGLGATSMTFYEVYTQVSEMHLRDIGLNTEWHEVSMLDKGEVTWEGIVRRYWSIPCAYRLPISRLDY